MHRNSMTRHEFLKIMSLATAAGLGIYTGLVEPHWLELVRRPLSIRNLPLNLVGHTLVQISDIHMGLYVDDNYIISVFNMITDLHPDIVIFTGDFITYHPEVFTQFPSVYKFFPTGRLATLAILGNHDYGPEWSHPDVADRIVQTVQLYGVTVLRNEVVDVSGLQIAGFDDWWGNQFQAEPVWAALNPNGAMLALSHNPDTVDLPVWQNYQGWILAGHTHGGQCKPPFLPPPILPVSNQRYTAGEFVLSGNRQMYISRGVGHLLPVRFNVRPEVTVFELRSA